MEQQENSNDQSYLKEKEGSWRHYMTWIQSQPQSYSNLNSMLLK